VLRLPDLGGSSRYFKQPLTPKTHHVLRLARRTPANRRSEGSSTSSKVDPFCFSVPNCRLSASTRPPHFRGGGLAPHLVGHYSTAHRSCSYTSFSLSASAVSLSTISCSRLSYPKTK
jgi:hypothetical protein